MVKRISFCMPALFAAIFFIVSFFALLVCDTAQAARMYGGGVGSAGGMGRGPGSGPPGGVGGMGYGRAAPPAPPSSAAPSPYGSERDFQRGYAGNVPNDPWHRDADFSARDYQLRHGPAPQHAYPPHSAGQHRPNTSRTPSLVIPRLPRESALPQDSTDPTGVKEQKTLRRKANGREAHGRGAHGPSSLLEGRGRSGLKGR